MNIFPDWLRIQASQELTILSFHLWYAYSPTRATKDHMQYTMIWYRPTHRCSQCSLFLSSLVRQFVACMRIELIVFVLLARRSNQQSKQVTFIIAKISLLKYVNKNSFWYFWYLLVLVIPFSSFRVKKTNKKTNEEMK